MLLIRFAQRLIILFRLNSHIRNAYVADASPDSALLNRVIGEFVVNDSVCILLYDLKDCISLKSGDEASKSVAKLQEINSELELVQVSQEVSGKSGLEEKNKAAIKIQAVQRGRIGRKKVEAVKREIAQNKNAIEAKVRLISIFRFLHEFLNSFISEVV